MRIPAKEPIHFNAAVAEQHAIQLEAVAHRLKIPFTKLVSLVLQYGPQVVPIIIDVASAFEGGFSWSKLSVVMINDGPLVVAIAEKIAADLGVMLPEIPAMQSN